MLELGKRQTLKVVKNVEFGVYLAEDGDRENRVLLPKKQVPAGTEIGSELEVFLYKDSKDRMIATTAEPKAKIGEIAVMKVKEVGKIGAFLDWGLEKDLFLPFREMTTRVRIGDEVLVAVYADKSSRLCATMKVYNYLRKDSPYVKNDYVRGRIYEVSDNFGAFVAVDDMYSGLINKQEYYGIGSVGTLLTARVCAVKEDGKLDLSMREKIPQQMEKDAAFVMHVIESYDGVLPFNDKVSPEIIEREMCMSKNAFKRAVGHLLKMNKIEIKENCIRAK